MALMNIGGPVILPPTFPSGAGTGLTIDATLEIAAVVFQASYTGTLIGITFRVSVSVARTLRIGIQSVDGSGLPSGTWLGATAAGYYDQTSPTTGYYNVTLGESVSLVAGTWYAVVIRWADDTVGGGWTGSVTVQARALRTLYDSASTAYYPYNCYTVNPVSTKTAGNVVPDIGLIYTGGVCNPAPFHPTLTTSNITVSLDSDGTIRAAGNRFQMPHSARVIGVAWVGDTDQDCTPTLYSDAGVPLTSGAYDTDYRGSTNNGLLYFYFSTPYTVVANTWYRIGIEAGSTTAANAIYKSTYDEAALLGQNVLGVNCYYTSRGAASTPPVAGDWTDAPAQRALCGVIIDQIDTAIASGGSYGY